VQLPVETEASFDLASPDGRVVKSMRARGRSATIDISDVPAGAYILRIRTSDGEIARNVQVAR